MKIHYVTQNPGKFEEAAKVLEGIALVHTPLQLEEIQGSSRQIAEHKILQAQSLIHEPCLIDDISLTCPAIGGLPGPYVRAFLETIGDKGLAELISHYEDRSCQVICHIAYADEKGQTHLFEGRVDAAIVMPRGKRMAHTHSWNAIVEPKGYKQTFAEMSLDDAAKISARSKALTQFKNYII